MASVYKPPTSGHSSNQWLTPLAGLQKYQCLTNFHRQASVMVLMFNNSYWQASVITNIFAHWQASVVPVFNKLPLASVNNYQCIIPLAG
ncbi:hypothetical protein SLEP1_g22583 [Rubroshorea leprosula]|uniref:Uncharacterized protein n=1 Tax=Rubroshorea leprosula TaxID=152421 RepID=A0AAV5J9M2_9ROSI|nr:hypothetical protein SLEP1_g22583 [Rubroshorea leprosula]